MSSINVRGARWAIGLAAGAVLVGHGLTYALVHPDAHHRAGVLAATGHAYLHLLEGPGAILAIASAVTAAVIGLGRLGHTPDRWAVFRWLATVQLVAFVGMEVAERVAAGSHVAAGDAAVLAVGVAVQLALAYGGAWLLDLLRRSGERLATTLAVVVASPLPRATLVLHPPVAAVPHAAPTLGPDPARGPPRRP